MKSPLPKVDLKATMEADAAAAAAAPAPVTTASTKKEANRSDEKQGRQHSARRMGKRTTSQSNARTLPQRPRETVEKRGERLECFVFSADRCIE